MAEYLSIEIMEKNGLTECPECTMLMPFGNLQNHVEYKHGAIAPPSERGKFFFFFFIVHQTTKQTNDHRFGLLFLDESNDDHEVKNEVIEPIVPKRKLSFTTFNPFLDEINDENVSGRGHLIQQLIQNQNSMKDSNVYKPVEFTNTFLNVPTFDISFTETFSSNATEPKISHESKNDLMKFNENDAKFDQNDESKIHLKYFNWNEPVAVQDFIETKPMHIDLKQFKWNGSVADTFIETRSKQSVSSMTIDFGLNHTVGNDTSGLTEIGNELAEPANGEMLMVYCCFCNAEMPTKSLVGHIVRQHKKHWSEEKAAQFLDESIKSEKFVKCDICLNGMRLSALSGHRARKHANRSILGTIKNGVSDQEFIAAIKNGKFRVDNGIIFSTV